MSARQSSSPEAPARYIMVGGFLGAGKTTAIDRLARVLTGRGLRVGLITNDQGSSLVDTALLRSHGHAVEEIGGGCFCCRFNSLREAAGRLTAATRPDIFLAEPVGSCTDLVATVSYPLRRLYGDSFRIAPLSVLVDPDRAARILGLAPGRSFSDKVLYVYGKQLEEADLIVVNKCDALDPGLRDRLGLELARRHARAGVLYVSAREGDGVGAWLDRVLAGEGATGPTIDVDYDAYAEGEARLGWLNATFAVDASQPFDGNALLVRLSDTLRHGIASAGAEIAHLKLTLDPADAEGLLSVVSVTGSGQPPDLRESLLDRISAGSLIVNLRAEMDPGTLSELVASAIAAESDAGRGPRFMREHEEHFRPARPIPTHRVAVAAGARPADSAAGEGLAGTAAREAS